MCSACRALCGTGWGRGKAESLQVHPRALRVQQGEGGGKLDLRRSTPGLYVGQGEGRGKPDPHRSTLGLCIGDLDV